MGTERFRDSKSYEMIPKEKNCLNKKQLGAVLLSETIYEEGEDFGEFTDAEILKLTNSETGMGQYSRAFCCGTYKCASGL